MKPVSQDRFGFGNGNCVGACLASIFERDIREFDNLDGYHGEVVEWTTLNFPHLTACNVDIAINFLQVDMPGLGWRWTYDLRREWPWPPFEDALEYWMCSVESRGVVRPESDPYFPLPALHAVVYKRDQLVHDPNPKYGNEPYDRDQVVSMTWWEHTREVQS